MKEKILLFSLTRKDFDFQTFCTGGKGGQHRNAKQNGVRCIHPPSGSVAEHRDGRDQFKNKMEAFRKCCETPVFKAWHRVETLRRLGLLRDTAPQDIEKVVDEQMKDVKVEYFDGTGANTLQT